uniref:Probable 2-phosphosulfolactate phosphatase n=1 Tax=uncultured Verrucomicrobiales bacterium HF0200_39L05 TaxID=710997 RepID=E0XUQ0_9BACT|nr:phosphosulfolactate phosphohydrolase and related enzymes [uncultured Verrucomicrobiales bacterium HF0200_39L05]
MDLPKLDVLLSPVEFEALPRRDLSTTCCVVFDVLRATSTITVALANGAIGILPCGTTDEAIAAREVYPDLLLAGERGGLRITAQVSGSVDFDLGNSPREMVAEVISGRQLAMTTTNGTHALKACAGAQRVWIGGFLNLSALGQTIHESRPERLLLVCAGTGEVEASEDVIGAGALCDLLWDDLGQSACEAALIARDRYLNSCDQLYENISQTKNARRLLSIAGLADDVEYCLQRDAYPVVGEMTSNGWIAA